MTAIPRIEHAGDGAFEGCDVPLLSIDQATVHYDGSSAPALKALTLHIRTGEIVVLVGRSGCGKTTALKLAAGFLRPTEGGVLLDGRHVTGPGADRAVVFQDDALFPWLSARDNVAFALRLKGVSKRERHRTADRLLDELGLTNAGSKPIWELSGGMRQRIGLARALAAEPDFLLMDEPLGALDALTRERTQELLLSVTAQSGAGVLLITHGIEEALFLGTRVVVLAPGPGRVVAEYAVDFGRRFLAGEPARAVKSDPAFIAARERVAADIHAWEPA